MLTGEEYYSQYINGNDSAFERVMSAYYDCLVLFVNGYLHSLSDSEDVASECFLHIAIHKRKYNFSTSLKTYLFTLGRSRALNFLKKKNRKKTANLDDYTHLFSDKDAVDMVVEQNERNVALYQAINQLASDMRTVLYLFYFENMSYDEVAKITSKSKKQIDNLLYRAKKELKIILKKEGSNNE